VCLVLVEGAVDQGRATIKQWKGMANVGCLCHAMSQVGKMSGLGWKIQVHRHRHSCCCLEWGVEVVVGFEDHGEHKVLSRWGCSQDYSCELLSVRIGEFEEQ